MIHEIGNASAGQNFEYIDLSYLERMTSGNEKFIVDMLQIFLDMFPQAMRAMKLSLDNKNAKDLYQVAHKMKSSFRILGNNELIELATLVDKESVVETPDWDRLNKDVNRMISLGELAIPEVKNVIAKFTG
ncbi:MAG: hypothetical protein DHS20C18_23440 [Saprospiraceae bacterium]|nr:MAG: hypothetical protein DHS20C18_23440 [Saprospiraceae bacterium]